jgi:branched-chain amino acid transport system permease protein
VERVIVRPVENGPEINAVIVTLGIFVGLVALASVLFGNTFEGFAAPFSLRGLQVGDTSVAITPNNLFNIAAVLVAMAVLLGIFRYTSLGLQMRASAFGQEVARLLGVRVGRMLTLGWALAGLFGSLAGILIAGGGFISPSYMDGVVVFGFVAAVLGGLDSFVGAVVGGLVLGLTTVYVQGYVGQELQTLAALAILMTVLLVRPGGLFSSTVARKV